jgi:hypothetical protein
MVGVESILRIASSRTKEDFLKNMKLLLLNMEKG